MLSYAAASSKIFIKLSSSRAGTDDGFISVNLLKNDTCWSMSIRVCSPSRWDTQTRTGAPNPAAPLYSNNPRAITAFPTR